MKYSRLILTCYHFQTRLIIQQGFLMLEVKLKRHNGAKTETVTAQSSEYNLPTFQCLPRDSRQAQISRGREVVRPGRAPCLGRSRRNPQRTREPCLHPPQSGVNVSSLTFKSPKWPLKASAQIIQSCVIDSMSMNSRKQEQDLYKSF